MKAIIKFVEREPVLAVTGVLAVLSAFFVPPDLEYIGYCNFSVLGILFCLMMIVAGLSDAGLFDVLKWWLCQRIHCEKWMVFVLCILCFLGSALITNDVALITFVPFTLGLLRGQGERTAIFAVTMETVSANLGSIITPIGNPQNLYLYTFYNMSPLEFFRICLPLGGLCLLLICIILLLRPHGSSIKTSTKAPMTVQGREIGIYGVLFALCLCAVLKLLPYYVVFAIVVVFVLYKNRKLLRRVDYLLLLTFVCFFIVVGNAARLDWVSDFMKSALEGKELLVSILLSQVISNVPAATMLSAFTGKAGALLVGTNVGGLGTLVASMASLISYRQICASEHIRAGRYLAVFSVVNIGLLIVLAAPYFLFPGWFGL